MVEEITVKNKKQFHKIEGKFLQSKKISDEPIL